jgi:TonB family protein
VSTARSVLAPTPQPLWGWALLAVVGHGGLLLAGVLLSLLTDLLLPSKPIIDPDRTMQVSMVALPRADKPLPDKATRAPVPRGEVKPVPEPPPPKPEPEPVKVSDLKFEKKEAPKKEGVDIDRIREKIKRDQDRKKLLDNLVDAAAGSVDRDATDPDSTSDIAINALGAGAASDPEFARYKSKIQQLFMQHFSPIPAIVSANPGIECTVSIDVDPSSGRVLSHSITRGSGVPAYDAAALRAAQAVPTIPLPPEKYRPLVARGYQIIFKPA